MITHNNDSAGRQIPPNHKHHSIMKETIMAFANYTAPGLTLEEGRAFPRFSRHVCTT